MLSPRFFPLVIALGWLLGQPAASQAAPGFVHADGVSLRDGQGRELHLRGVNLGGWLLWEGWIWGGGFQSETTLRTRLAKLVGQPAMDDFGAEVYRRFVTEADIAAVARLGFNVVRVPFSRRLLEDADAAPGVYKESGWRVLDTLLDWCERHGVYAVLDLHGAPGGQSWAFVADPEPEPAARLWNSALAQDRTVALWRAIATRYRDRAIVAGYDLLNEPNPPNGSALADLTTRLISAVRAVDGNHAIFVEGADAAKDFSMFPVPPAPNIVYSFHIYNWLGDDRLRRLNKWRKLAERQKVPLWNGEFGENNAAMLRSTVAMFDDPCNLVSGYGFWTWKRVPNQHAGLCTFQPPAEWKKLVDWLAFPRLHARPTVQAAQEAMRGFLEAVNFQRCEVNPEAADIFKLPVN